MENEDTKSKNFIQRHKTGLIIGGMVVLASVYGTWRYTQGFKRGGIIGFHATIDWFESEFPDMKLRNLYEEWAKLHPEQLVSA